MDTRPERAEVAEPQSTCDRNIVGEPDTRCPRQRFFVEARKRDDGDAVRIAEER
jgi:hypothetical protein